LLSPYDADLVRRDTAIPGLATLLDPEALVCALRRTIDDRRQTTDDNVVRRPSSVVRGPRPKGAVVRSARATYVRYKPGMNCLVAYELDVDGVVVEAYAKAHRADASDQLRKAREQPGVPGPLGAGRIVLPGQAVVVSTFPNDSELRRLERVASELTPSVLTPSVLTPSWRSDADAWQLLLRKVFRDRPDLWEGTVSSIRYKPERRYVAQLSTASGPQAVIKVYTETGYSEARGTSRAFKSRDVLQVPRRIGRSDRHRVLAFEWMQGQLLSEHLSDSSLDPSALQRVGIALAEAHTQHRPQRIGTDRAAPLPHLTREMEASSLMAVAAGLAFLCPHLAARVNDLARRLAARIMQEPPVNVPTHGDFYAKQVLLAGDKVVILDFDSAAIGDPATDLGLFTAHLERGALHRNLPAARVEPLRDSLLAGYELAGGMSASGGRSGVGFPSSTDPRSPAPDPRSPAPDPWRSHVLDRVGLYTAAGLLRLAPHPFRNRRPDWPQQIEATVERAEALALAGLRAGRFESHPSQTFQPSNLPTFQPSNAPVVDPFKVTADPAMPFLSLALNPLDVEMQFRRRLADLAGPGGQLHVLAIRVVRHKPGRRCLIEYDLAVERVGGGTQLMTVVGKARARGLDKGTYGTFAALWRAGFDDRSRDGISVPRPVGMVPEFQMWLHGKVPGTSATELLQGPGGVELSGRIAEAIHKLHRAGLRPASRHTMADELRILHERLPLVASWRPEWEKRIQRLLASCDALGAETPALRPVGIHRDFYADQVIVDGSRLYLLDFDLYCQGNPALDVGNFLGHMKEHSLRTLGDPDALADREQTLEDRFVELCGAHPSDAHAAVQAYTTLTLARHVYLSTRFTDRRDFTGDLLDLCEERLKSSQKSEIRNQTSAILISDF
jgi:aminoglycoside phosphotransferase (APT) family kinase protein